MKVSEFCSFDSTTYQHAFAIEQAANPTPMSQGLFKSCIGGRYFNQQLTIDGECAGFYIGDQVLDEVTLTEICVSPARQRQGLGKKLLTHFLQTSIERGAIKAFLEVRASNIGAQLLYIDQGFVQINRRTAYYPKENGFEDALVMVKELA